MSKFSAICNCLYIWKIFYVLYALFVLLCLSLSGVLRTAQRNFLGIVATPIQRDLHVSDVFFGLIAGPIFSFSSATSGIIVGRLSDVYSRKWIFVICSILCGVATSLHGLVSTDIHLLWCRVFLAVSTSGFTPISVSLLSDYFPEKFRGIALSALTFSSVVGSGVAFGFGLFVKLQTSNWKNLFFIMGLPSIFLGLFMIFFIWEPERGRYDKQERESNVKNKTSFISSLKFILSNSSLWFLNIGIGFCFMASNASLTWLPTFFYRVHNIPIDELSSYLSWTTTTGSIFGALLGGILADRLGQRNNRWLAIMPILSILIMIPIQIAIYLQPITLLSILLTLPTAIVALSMIPSLYLLGIKLVPVSMRSLNNAVFMFFLGGIGSVGPLIVGGLNELNIPYFDMQENPMAIRYSMLCIGAICFSIGLLSFTIMFFLIPRDTRRLNEWIESHKASPPDPSPQVVVFPHDDMTVSSSINTFDAIENSKTSMNDLVDLGDSERTPLLTKSANNDKADANILQEDENLNHRIAILTELYTTEKSYVENLKLLQTSFSQPLAESGIISKKLHEQIFGNISIIHGINQHFLKELDIIYSEYLNEKHIETMSLEEKRKTVEKVEENLGLKMTFLTHSFKLYSTYIITYEKTFDLVSEESAKNEKFKEFLKETASKLVNDKHRISEITSFLILPVQRLPRYKLLLEDLLKRIPSKSKENKSKYNIELAKDAIGKVTEYVNEKQNDYGNIGKIFEVSNKLRMKSLIVPNRRFINSIDDLKEYVTTGSSSSNIVPAVRSGSKKKDWKSGRSLYLFSDQLVISHKSTLLGTIKNQEITFSDIQSIKKDEILEATLTIIYKINLLLQLKFPTEEKANEWLDNIEKQILKYQHKS